jgi:integrase
MPATQRGQVDQIGPKRWRLRYYLPSGERKSKQPFSSKSAAWAWFREHIEPLFNDGLAPLPELTLAEFVPLYLERHAAVVQPRSIRTLRERLPHATRAFGDVRLRELERMSGEIAAWQARLPERSRYGITQALRQTLEAAMRWGYIQRNPAKLAGRNRQPAPRTVRPYTRAELDAITAELAPRYRVLPEFVAATGLRPEEWQVLERRDVDRRAGVITVLRTISEGEVVELAKNNRSRREVPLRRRALAALDALPPRLDTPLLFPAPHGGVINLNNFRRRVWAPAIKASGVSEPARIYDLRATFASTAIRARVAIFELAKIMGTSVRMIELHYGSLLDGAGAAIASRLDAYDEEQDQAAAEEDASGV